jgi:DNA-binding transcriptional ArsR family regulator
LTFRSRRQIVKRVINQPQDIDRLLHALADPTRRLLVERLGSGPASVSVLAAPLPMSLPAVVQHLAVLEGCGLVASEKVGRVRTCRLEPERLADVGDWIAARRATWERRLDRLGDVLAAEATDGTTQPSPSEEDPT